VIEPNVDQLNGCAAEIKRALLIDGLIGQRSGWILQKRQALLRPFVGDDLGAGVLERLATGDMVVVMMFVDQVLYWFDSNLFDLVNTLSPPLAVRNRSGRWRRPHPE
jgi:hypothetical protein